MEPVDWMKQELRDELREEFMLDPNIPLSIRYDFAKVTEDLRWIEHFTNSPSFRFHREQAIEQRVAVEIFDEFAERLKSTENVAAWLKKRGRTPEVVLLHQGHEIGMSISFRLPTDDENVVLAWDMRPYGASKQPDHPLASYLSSPGLTVLMTDKGLRYGRDRHGDRAAAGGSRFEAESKPVEVAYDVYRRERDNGNSTLDAARVAGEAKFEAPHNFAPTRVKFDCWCGQTMHVRWMFMLQNIERSLRPGHVRVENKRIVATIPVH